MSNGNGKYGYIILGAIVSAVLILVFFFSIYMANDARAGVAENKTDIRVNTSNIINMKSTIDKIDVKVDKILNKIKPIEVI